MQLLISCFSTGFACNIAARIILDLFSVQFGGGRLYAISKIRFISGEPNVNDSDDEPSKEQESLCLSFVVRTSSWRAPPNANEEAIEESV